MQRVLQVEINVVKASAMCTECAQWPGSGDELDNCTPPDHRYVLQLWQVDRGA